MKTIFVSIVAALTSVACSSSDPCNRNSTCPNDTPLTQSQKDQCSASYKANQSSACYSEVVTFNNCLLDNRVCGGDGKTDVKLSATQAENNCTNQKANVLSCCTKNANATACK